MPGTQSQLGGLLWGEGRGGAARGKLPKWGLKSGPTGFEPKTQPLQHTLMHTHTHTDIAIYCVLNRPIECFYVENVLNCKVSFACNIPQ